MPENFFRRWSQRKAAAAETAQPDAHAGDALQPAESAAASMPSLADVAALAGDADYGVFVGGTIDRVVHRAAMKKLFSDPHFNIMDGLDIYIDDYNRPSPLSAAMLGALEHARSTLAPQPAWQQVAPQTDADAATGGCAGPADIPDERGRESRHAAPDARPDAVPAAEPDTEQGSPQSSEPDAAGTAPSAAPTLTATPSTPSTRSTPDQS